jgi:predicted MPP superfamily phosphohydrolase
LNLVPTEPFCSISRQLMPTSGSWGAISPRPGTLAEHLRAFDRSLRAATYFTLGNHDFYGSSLDRVREQVRELVADSRHLVWLTDAGPQAYGDLFAIVGDDGWADAGYGNAIGTRVALNDFLLIAELTGLGRAELIQTLHGLGEAAAARLAPKLEQAAAGFKHVVVLTHVPPFKEAAWHQGLPSDEDWLPWFACRSVGEAILACAQDHPQTGFLVLCGHTHGSGICWLAPNVTVLTAAAEYGAPRVQQLFEIDSRTIARLIPPRGRHSWRRARP